MNSISKDWDQFLLDVGFSKKDVEHYMKNVIDTPEFSAIAGEVVDITKQSLIFMGAVFLLQKI